MDKPRLPGFQSACCILEKRILVGKSHTFLPTPEAHGWGGEGWKLACGLQPGLCSPLQDPRWTRESEHEGKNKNCSLELQPANLGMYHVSQMWGMSSMPLSLLVLFPPVSIISGCLLSCMPTNHSMDKEVVTLVPLFSLERDFLSIHLDFITRGSLPQICHKHGSSSSLEFSFFNVK